ncbi:MAG: hypothetical protein WDW36_002429 [Sanguina aurantia]
MVMHKRLARGFRTACHTGRDKEQQQPAARMLSLGLSYEDDDDEEEAGTSGPSIAPASTGSKAPESASLPSVEQAADDSDSGEGMELDDEPCAVKGGGPDKADGADGAKSPGRDTRQQPQHSRGGHDEKDDCRGYRSGREGGHSDRSGREDPRHGNQRGEVSEQWGRGGERRSQSHDQRPVPPPPPPPPRQRRTSPSYERAEDRHGADREGRRPDGSGRRNDWQAGDEGRAGHSVKGGAGQTGRDGERRGGRPVEFPPGGPPRRDDRSRNEERPRCDDRQQPQQHQRPDRSQHDDRQQQQQQQGGDRSRHDERHQGGDRFQGRPDADRSQNGDRQQQQQQQQGGTGSRAGEGQTGGVMVTGVAMARPVAPTTTAAALTAAAEAGTEPVGMAGTGVGTGARDVTAVGGTRGGRGRRRGAALSNGAVSSKAHGRTEIRGALSAPLGGSSRGGREDSDELRGGAAAKRPRDASSERMPPVAAVPAGPVMSSADIVRAMMGAPRAAGDTTASAATMSLADKKKLLWGAKKKVEQPDVSHSHEEVAVPIQADAVFGKNRWDGAEWQTTEAKSKFQRMMGVKTDHAEMLAGTTAPPQHTDDDFAGHVVMTKDAQAKVLQDVEEHFHAALRRKDGRTVGLGL